MRAKPSLRGKISLDFFFFLSETLFCLHNSFSCFSLRSDARRLQMPLPLVLKAEVASGRALVCGQMKQDRRANLDLAS